MIVEYSLRARADILSIFAYLHERSPQAALAVVQDIREQIETLSIFPSKGSKTTMRRARRLRIARRPYVAFYLVEGETITIVHIRHTSRQPWRGGAR